MYMVVKKQKMIRLFFVDKENDIYVGYVSGIKENDYFGYMKK